MSLFSISFTRLLYFFSSNKSRLFIIVASGLATTFPLYHWLKSDISYTVLIYAFSFFAAIRTKIGYIPFAAFLAANTANANFGSM